MHVVLLPWLAFGHIIPFTELAKRVAQQGHRVTLLSTPRNTRRLIDIPLDLAGLIRVVDVPLPRVEHLPDGAEASIDLPSDDLRPYLRLAYDAAFAPALSDILQPPAPSRRPDWVLTDYAAYWAPEAAARHGVPCAYVSLYCAAALAFFGTPDDLMGHGRHAKTSPEHLTVVPDFVPFPTAVAYRGHEARGMFAPVAVPDDVSGVAELYRSGMSIAGSQVVGIRSSNEFEPEWLRLLGELYQKPVIPVGLFPPPPPTHDLAVAGSGHEAALRWLDGQAPGSVVYAAFGSEAKLTTPQLEAIALGLEASGLPFLWAFRAPGAGAGAADTGEGGGLPAGFEERMRGRGVVCRGWVPQVSFLAHGSVGAFLTHAGWNSVTEGLARGVKLVMLSLMFDQGLNARHLVEKKMGVEVARDDEDIAAALRDIAAALRWRGTTRFAPRDIAAALRRVMVEDDAEELGAKAKEAARVFGNDEAHDQCLRDFLRYLSEHSRHQ